MALALPQNNNFVWTPQATIQLIRERRTFHDQFERVPNNRHVNIWTIIANRVHAATNFVATPQQCRIKWNALKRGFENIIRIINNNPQGFLIRSPNNFNRCCFIEMSDQFWLRTGDYLF